MKLRIKVRTKRKTKKTKVTRNNVTLLSNTESNVLWINVINVASRVFWCANVLSMISHTVLNVIMKHTA